MNIELLKQIETSILETIGMLVLDDITHAKQNLRTLRAGLYIVIKSWEENPMTIEELEEEFRLREAEIANNNNIINPRSKENANARKSSRRGH